MARVIVLGQVKEGNQKVQLRGVFTQKKKLWQAIETIAGPIQGKFILDDVSGKEYDATYANLCNRLRLIGRATLLGPDKQRECLIIESMLNEIRDWDTDENNNPKLNPVKGNEDDKEGE
jgi:hypothetical protein